MAIPPFLHILRLPLPQKHFPPRNWEKLGERKVNYKLDRDEIFVTAKDGRFNAIQLRFKVAPINLHRCVIHFRNGTTQSVALKNKFLPGQTTRVIDIKGKRRIIKKVVFYYDTRGLRPGKGRVELWGRHF